MPSIVRILLLLAFAFSCSQDDFPEHLTEPTVMEGKVEIFQIFKFQVSNLPDSVHSFEGTLGNQKVHMGRYSKDFLVFIIPFISEGSHLLSLSIDGEEKRWTIEITHPYLDINYEEYFEDYFTSVEELRVKLGGQAYWNEWSKDFDSWVNKYHKNYSSLSDNDKKTVLGTMHHHLFRQIFQTGSSPLGNLESQTNLLQHTGSQTHHQRFYNLDQLEIILSLPNQPLYQTLALGLGVGLWYRNGLNEFLAQQILEFPTLRELSFYKIDPLTKEEELVDKLILESGEPSSFTLYGNYQTVNENDLTANDAERIGTLASFFSRAETYRSLTDSVINDFLGKFSLNLPGLGNDLTHKLPAQAQLIKTKLPPDLVVELRIPTIGVHEYSLRKFEESEGTAMVMMESLTGTVQEFSMEILIKKEQDLRYIRSVDILLKVSCPLIFRFVIDDFQPALDIAFGTPPYSFNWIQGAETQDQSDMPPGNYEVEVIDALGCERRISFTIPEFGEVADNEGNLYRTVKIGNQWWMAENLRSGKLADGTPIALLDAAEKWRSSMEPGFSWYNNEEDFDQAFGKLYNGYIACCEICPEGWRLPMGVDWRQMIEYLNPFPAGKLKAKQGWENAGLTETNSSGFSGVAAGGRTFHGAFFGKGTTSYYLSITEDKQVDAFYPSLTDGENGFGFAYDHTIRGFPSTNTRAYSIRCIKD